MRESKPRRVVSLGCKGRNHSSEKLARLLREAYRGRWPAFAHKGPQGPQEKDSWVAWTLDLTTTVLVARQAPGSKPQGGLREVLRWNPGSSSCRPRTGAGPMPLLLASCWRKETLIWSHRPLPPAPSPQGREGQCWEKGREG